MGSWGGVRERAPVIIETVAEVHVRVKVTVWSLGRECRLEHELIRKGGGGVR